MRTKTPSGALAVDRIVIRIPRPLNQWTCTLYTKDSRVPTDNCTFRPQDPNVLWTSNGIAVGDLTSLFQAFSQISQTLYIGPFRNALNIGSGQPYYDIQVGQAFISQWRNLKTGKSTKENDAIYSLTQDIKNIFEFENLEINAASDNDTLQVYINGKSYRLASLGSGLTQFILVLANAATQSPTYILIDEPELNLHPTLQIDFLTTLGSYASEGVLFATHNIGLARAAAERVYSFRKKSEFESHVTRYEATPQLSEFLGALSFPGYREIGYDAILLVEGTKDVKTIQQFLRTLHADHRVLLLPLGGSALINGSPSTEHQFEEMKRISTHVFALIDSERESENAELEHDRAGFVALCRRTNIECHVLERRAIENYLTEQAIKRCKGDRYRALGHFELLKDVHPAWSKDENWRIARGMPEAEWSNTDLGTFLKHIAEAAAKGLQI